MSDLTEQVRQLELEKAKLNSNKEEVQNKLIQISNSAKKLQVITKNIHFTFIKKLLLIIINDN